MSKTSEDGFVGNTDKSPSVSMVHDSCLVLTEIQEMDG